MKLSDLLAVAVLVFATTQVAGVQGCAPPVPPGPPPAPPIVTSGLAVLVVDEPQERHKVTKGQRDVLQSIRLRDLVLSKNGRMRTFDKDLSGDDLKFTGAEWKAAFERAKRESQGKYPWWLVTNGRGGVSESLPDGEGKAIEVVERWAK